VNTKKFNRPVTEDNVAPAGKAGQCTWCGAKIGELHKQDCVVPRRPVKLQVTFEIESQEPFTWTQEQIEYHYNKGRYCGINWIYRLEHIAEKNNDCLCDITSVKYKGEIP
jgi:hypothetical protein